MAFIKLFSQSIKELFIYRTRTILTFFSVFISSVLISLVFLTSNSLPDVLTRLITSQSSKEYQLSVNYDDLPTTIAKIDIYMRETNSTQVRALFRVPILNGKVTVGDKVVNVQNIYFFDNNYCLVTDKELESAFETTDSGYWNLQSYVTESFLIDSEISDSSNKCVSFTVLDSNGKEIYVENNIEGVISSNIQSCMNVKTQGDLYMDLSIIENYESIPVIPVDIVFEYSSFEDVSNAADYFNKNNVLTTIYAENVDDIEAELIIYTAICRALEIVALLSIVICVFLMFSVSFNERESYYGILKAVGFTDYMIFYICIVQSVVLGVLASIVGYFFSVLLSGYAVEKILSSLLSVFNRDINLKPVLQFDSFSFVVITVIIACIIGALIPAIKVSRKQPLLLLEHTDNE